MVVVLLLFCPCRQVACHHLPEGHPKGPPATRQSRQMHICIQAVRLRTAVVAMHAPHRKVTHTRTTLLPSRREAPLQLLLKTSRDPHPHVHWEAVAVSVGGIPYFGRHVESCTSACTCVVNARWQQATAAQVCKLKVAVTEQQQVAGLDVPVPQEHTQEGGTGMQVSTCMHKHTPRSAAAAACATDQPCVKHNTGGVTPMPEVLGTQDGQAVSCKTEPSHTRLITCAGCACCAATGAP